MDSFSSLISAGVSALSSFATSTKGSEELSAVSDDEPLADEMHHCDDAFDGTDSETEMVGENLHEDWMVVMEEHSAVRTVPLGDIHLNRVRNRPALTRLWDAADDAADVLIERPLQASRKYTVSSKSYAAALAENLSLASEADAPAVSVDYLSESEAWSGDDDDGLWPSEPAVTRVGRHHSPQPSYIAKVSSKDIVDWIDVCRSDRVARRFMSRRHRFKGASAQPKYSSKRSLRGFPKTHCS
jgi:hypothetical protein